MENKTFKTVGKPLRAAVLTLSRQVLFLIPLIRILGRFYGLEGLLFAGPIADTLAAVITYFFITKEIPSYEFVPYSFTSQLIDDIVLNGKIY